MPLSCRPYNNVIRLKQAEMSNSDSREIPASDDGGCRVAVEGREAAREEDESGAPSLFDGLVQTRGKLNTLFI